MKKKLTQLKWLEAQIKKDNHELENEKQNLIRNIKKFKKEDILPKVVEPKKLTLCQKIKRILLGL